MGPMTTRNEARWVLSATAVLVLVYMGTFTLAQAAGIGELGARVTGARVLEPAGPGQVATVLVDRRVHQVPGPVEAGPEGTVEVFDRAGSVRTVRDDTVPAAFAAVCTLVAAVCAAGCFVYRVRDGEGAGR